MIYKRNNKYNEDVKKWQAKLGGITSDGYFGPKTEARVRKFQKNHNLTVDGIVGNQTLAVLNKPTADEKINKFNKSNNIDIGKINTDVKPTNEKYDPNSVKTDTINANANTIITDPQNAKYDVATDLNQKKTKINQDITDLEAKMNQAGQDRNSAYQQQGIWKDLETLNKLKAQKSEIDKDITWRIGERGRTALHGEGATQTDLRNLTGQSLRDAAINDSLVTDKINVYNQNVALRQAQIEQDYKTKMDNYKLQYQYKLDRVNKIESKYYDILSARDIEKLKINKSAIEQKMADDIGSLNARKEKIKYLEEKGYDTSNISIDTPISEMIALQDKQDKNRAVNKKQKFQEKIDAIDDMFKSNAGINSGIFAWGSDQDASQIVNAITDTGWADATGDTIATAFSSERSKDKKKALGILEHIISVGTLDDYAKIKQQGATFGALSDKELELLKSYSKTLASYAKYDSDNHLKGFDGDPKEIENLIKKEQSVFLKGYIREYMKEYNKEITPEFENMTDPKLIKEAYKAIRNKEAGVKPTSDLELYKKYPENKITFLTKTTGWKPDYAKKAVNILDTIKATETGYNPYDIDKNNPYKIDPYNIIYGGKQINLENMTIKQVDEYQTLMKKSGEKSTAAGAYQFLRGTLREQAKKLGLDPDTTKFNARVQDLLAVELLKRRGFESYLKGKISKKKFINNLSKEWASLPKDESNKSYYRGVAGNKALISYDKLTKLV